MHRSLLNKVGTACLHMALSASSLSAMGAAQSYYRTRRGAYGPNQTYLADTGVRPLSAFALGKKAEPKLHGDVVSSASNFHFAKGTRVRELVIVDGAVQDKSVFYKQNKPGVDVVEISGDGGILELMDILSRYSNLEAVHLVSHAKSGTLQIGGQVVDQATFEQNVNSFTAINGAIKEGGDLLLYGCDLAKGQKGENFLEIIKGNTHVDVAASTDKTGNAAYAANWELEVQKGDINATPLPESIAMNDFTGSLQFTGTIDFSHFAGYIYSGSYREATFNDTGVSPSYNLIFSSYYGDTQDGSGTAYVFYNATFWRGELFFSNTQSFEPRSITFSSSEDMYVYIGDEGAYLSGNTGGDGGSLTFSSIDFANAGFSTVYSLSFIATSTTVVELTIDDFEVANLQSGNSEPIINFPNLISASIETSESRPLLFSDDLIRISDFDGDNQDVTITASAGTLSLDGTPNTSGDQDASDAVLELTGTIVDINADLNQLLFTPAAQGFTSISIQTDDGNGGDDFESITVDVGPDNALNFDGTNDQVAVSPFAGLSETTEFTIEGWYNQNVLDVAGSMFLLRGDESNQIRARTWPDGNLYLYVHNAGSQNAEFDYSTVVTANEWFHFAMVYDGAGATDSDRLKLYIDGVEQSLTYNATIPSSVPVLTGDLLISEDLELDNAFWDGEMDEIRIWDIARSASEIASYKDVSLTGNETNLVAYYNFDEGVAEGTNTTVTTLPDLTPNVLDGTLNDGSGDSGASGFLLSGTTSNWVNGALFTPPAPEIDIQGNGISITDGDLTPEVANQTDFGDVAVENALGSTKTFTIENIGTATLNISSIGLSGTDASAFAIMGTPPTTIAAGASAPFDVLFITASLGIRNATITVNSDDADESAYDFAVTGNGINASVQTYIVGNTNDSGPGSLRQAIIDANANAPSDDIINMTGLTPGDLINLISALPVITDGVTINGPLNGGVILPGNSPVFSAPNSGINLILSDLTVTGGTNTTGAGINFTPGVGGGFLSLTRVRVEGNGDATTTAGGGIYYDSDNVNSVITQSTIINNTANDGAGIFIAQGTVSIDNTTIANNITGGGVFGTAVTVDGDLGASKVVLSHVTVAGNDQIGVRSTNGGLVDFEYSIFYGNPTIDLQVGSLLELNALNAESIIGTGPTASSIPNSNAGAFILTGDPDLAVITSVGDHTDALIPSSTGAAANASLNGTVSTETIDQLGNARAGTRTLGSIEVTANSNIAGTVAAQLTNDDQTVTVFSGTTLAADGDISVSVTLDDENKGVLTTLGSFVDAGSGVYTLASTDPATATSAIQALVFDPTDARVEAPGSETTTFTIDIDAGGGDTDTDAVTTVISTNVETTPALGTTDFDVFTAADNVTDTDGNVEYFDIGITGWNITAVSSGGTDNVEIAKSLSGGDGGGTNDAVLIDMGTAADSSAISSNDGSEFQLNSFDLNITGTSPDLTITGYKDGVLVATESIGVTPTGLWETIDVTSFTNASDFRDIDAFSVQFVGGSATEMLLDDIVITAAVITTSASSAITDGGFTPSTTIEFTGNTGNDVDFASAVGAKVAEFTIDDGDGVDDSDAVGTTLTDLTLDFTTLAAYGDIDNLISRVALYDQAGTVEIDEVAISGGQASFTGLSLATADNATNTFSVIVTFETGATGIEDNITYLDVLVSAATADPVGSTFAQADAGAPQFNTGNTINVTADRLSIDFAPSTVPTGTDFTILVSAVDVNGNIDTDENTTLAFSEGANFNGASPPDLSATSLTGVSLISGKADLSDLQIDAAGTGLVIDITDEDGGTPLTATSTTLDAINATPDSDADVSLDPSAGSTAIDYLLYQSTGGALTSSGTVQLAEIDLIDGGGADGLPSYFSDVEITFNSNVVFIEELGLFNGSTLLGTGNVGGTNTVTNIIFDVPVEVADGSSLTLSLRAAFSTTAFDKDNVVVEVTSANLESYGTDLTTTITGGVTNDIGVPPSNDVNVIATGLGFAELDNTAGVNNDFFATVAAIDINGNVDVDETSNVTLAKATGAPAGNLTSATGLTQPLAGGVYSWTDLRLDQTGFFDFEVTSGGGLGANTTGTLEVVNNNPPTGADFTTDTRGVPVYEGLPYAFETADFGYNDIDTNPFVELRINTIPATGTLFMDLNEDDIYDGGSEEIFAGSTLIVTDITLGRFKFIPASTSDESFTFQVNDNIDFSTAVNTATIESILGIPTVTLAFASATVGEAGSAVNLTATLSNEYGLDVTVDLGFSGTAVDGGDDYTKGSLTSDQIVIAAGNPSNSGTITPDVNAITEADETVIVDIVGVTNGTEDGTQQTTLTINDDDIAVLTINDVTRDENADGATSTFTFTVTLAGEIDQAFDVDFATTNGTATTAGSDYTAASGTLNFTAFTNGSDETFNVTISDDDLVEADETFTVGLSNVTLTGHGFTITDTGTGTIDNDDVAEISSVNLPIAGTYAIGDVLTIEVNYDNPVDFTDGGADPTLDLMIGSNTRAATYTGGDVNDATSFDFTYTIVDGDEDTDGIVIDAGSISANGGTFEDDFGGAAVLTLNSIESRTDVLVDGIRPIFTSAVVENADPNQVLVTFSENVTTDGTGFTIDVDGTAYTLGGATNSFTVTGGSGTSVVDFTLNSSIPSPTGLPQGLVTVAYTDPASSDAVDDNGNEMATFTAQSVTNEIVPIVTDLSSVCFIDGIAVTWTDPLGTEPADWDSVYVFVSEGAPVDLGLGAEPSTENPLAEGWINDSPIFGDGSIVGNASLMYVSESNPTSLEMTGFTAGTDYHFAVYTFRDNTGTYAWSEGQTLIAQPTLISDFVVSGGLNTMELNWTLPAGSCFTNVVIVASENANLNIDINEPELEATSSVQPQEFTNALDWGNINQSANDLRDMFNPRITTVQNEFFSIYNGNNSVETYTLSNVAPGTTLFFGMYLMGPASTSTGGTDLEVSPVAIGTGTTGSAPIDVSNLIATCASENEINLTWTKPAGVFNDNWDGVVVYALPDADPTQTFTGETVVKDNDDGLYGVTNTDTENGAYQIAYLPNDANGDITVSGFPGSATEMRFVVYSFRETGGSTDVFSTGQFLNVEPDSVASSSVIATAGNEEITLQWENPMNSPCPFEVLVVATQNTSVDVDVNQLELNLGDYSSTTLNADPIFGSGRDVNDLIGGSVPNNTHYIVYRGTGELVRVTGLTNGQDYAFKIFMIGTDNSATTFSTGQAEVTDAPFAPTGTLADGPQNNTTIASTSTSSHEAVFDFTITDDGATPATDSRPTRISQLVFSDGAGGGTIADWTDVIASAQLVDSDANTITGVVSTGPNAITFDIASTDNDGAGEVGFIADDASKTYTLQLTINSSLSNPESIDNDVFWIELQTSDILTEIVSSSFITNTLDADGGSGVSVDVDVSAIQVLIEPSTTATTNVALTQDAVFEAVDANGFRDLDFSNAIDNPATAGDRINNVDDINMANTPAGFIAGIYDMAIPSFAFRNEAGDGTLTLTVTSPFSGSATTNTITVVDNEIPVYAKDELNVTSLSPAQQSQGFNFVVNLNERDLTVFYYVSQSSTPPSYMILEDGIGAEGNGSFNYPVRDIDQTELIQGLNPVTQYYVHTFARDISGNVSAIETTNPVTTTTDAANPTLTINTFDSNDGVNLLNTSLYLNARVDEVATVYWIVSESDLSGDPPTAAEIKAGQDNLGDPAFRNGSFDVDVPNIGFEDYVTFLERGTPYYLYAVAEDEADLFSTVEPATGTTANVVITDGVDIGTEATFIELCVGDDFSAMDDIPIYETDVDDFEANQNNAIFILTVPDEMQFQTGLPITVTVNPINGTTGTDLTINSSFVTSNTIFIAFSSDATANRLDSITISGVSVKAVSSTPGVNLERSPGLIEGGSAEIFGNFGGSGRSHYEFIATDPPLLSRTSDIDAAQDGRIEMDADTITTLANIRPFTFSTSDGADEIAILDESGTEVFRAPFSGNESPSLVDYALNTTSYGIHSFDVIIVDDAGPFCASISERVFITIFKVDLNPDTQIFTEDDNVGTTITLQTPTGYTGLFTGDGLVNIDYDNPESTADFRPSVAGQGTEVITYQLTDDLTGETFSETITFTITSSADIFDSNQSVDFCDDETVLFNTLNNPSTFIAFNEFYDLQYFSFPGGVDVTSDVYAGGTPGQSLPLNPIFAKGVSGDRSDWEIDVSAYDEGDGRVDTIRVVMRTVSTITGAITQDAGSALIYVYDQPEVQFSNLLDSKSATPLTSVEYADGQNNDLKGATINYVCVTDDAFTLGATITNPVDGTITAALDTAYRLMRGTLTGAAADSIYRFDQIRNFAGEAGGIQLTNTFDPGDPSQSGTEDLVNNPGIYRLDFITRPQTAAECTDTTHVFIDVRPQPVVPTLSNVFTSVGELVGTDYVLEFCSGSTVPNYNATLDGTFEDKDAVAGAGERINWYSNDLGTIPFNTVFVGGAANKDGTINIADAFFGGNTNPVGRQSVEAYFTVTQDINIGSSGFDGCESEVRAIFTEVYPDPEVPTLDLSANFDGSGGDPDADIGNNEYVFEYCAPLGGSATIENIDLNNTLEISTVDEPNIGDETYFVIYDQDKTPLDSITTDIIVPGNPTNSGGLNFAGDAGTSVSFFVTQVNRDNGFDAGNGQTEFRGCEGDSVKITINVFTDPDAPIEMDFTTARTDYYLCSGETLDNIESPSEAGAIYTWYNTINGGSDQDPSNDTPDFTSPITVGAFSDRFITQTELETGGGFNNVNNSFDSLVYVYWVTQTIETNEETGFVGCESDPVRIVITVYPDPPAPVFTDSDLVVDMNASSIIEDWFCEGDLDDAVYYIVDTTSNMSTTFNWYRTASDFDISASPLIFSSSSPKVTGSDLRIIQATEADDDIIYFAVTAVNNNEPNGANFNGCESEPSVGQLTINVYDVPGVPDFSPNGGDNFITNGNVTNYYFVYDSLKDYDDQIGNGGFFIISGEGNTELIGGMNEVDEEFLWYYNNTEVISGPNNASFDDANPLTDLFNVLPAAGGVGNGLSIETFTYEVSQRQDSVENGSSVVLFDGCEGPRRTVNINVLPIPVTPLPEASLIYLCENDSDPLLAITNQVPGAQVEWWDGDPTLVGSTRLARTAGSSYTFTGLATGIDDIGREVWVRQVTNFNIPVGSGSFAGSFSEAVRIEINQYEEPLTPTVSYYGNASNNAIPTDILEVGVCSGNVASGLQFLVSSNNETSARFEWWTTQADGVTLDQLVYTTGNYANPGSPILVTGEDLNLAGAQEGIRTYRVGQVADFGSFDGCSTVQDNMQIVQVNIFRAPDLPTFEASDNSSFTSSGGGSLYDFYVQFDTLGNYNAQLENGFFTASGVDVDGIDVSPALAGTLDNIQNIEFDWYYNNTRIVANSSTADFTSLSLPMPSGPAGNPLNISTLTFEVEQGQFNGQNNNPAACYGDRVLVNVNVVPIPDIPSPLLPLVEVCEDETVNALSITNRAPGAQVQWFAIDPSVPGQEGADTLNVINGVLDGPTYTPTEVEGNPGSYTYYVRQVTNVGIDGTDFPGSVSKVIPVSVVVYPNAGVPQSTAGNNEYVYCLGDPIENLAVLNPESGVTYAWYLDINLNSFIGNTTRTNNSLTPDFGSFDENIPGTYNYYVTSTLSGQGCESDATLVEITINGLPDPEIKFNTGGDFENEEDLPEFYQICVDESPLAIRGSSSGTAVFGTFTGSGMRQGANGSATFDPLLALGIDDPLEMPEFGVDTIMVNYNLANTSDCDDDFQVGFVVTALPRPNFEASISSPFNVPVLLEDEDAGVACIDIDPNNLATVTRMTLRASGSRRTGQFILRNASRDTTLAIANGSVEFDLGLWSDKSKTQDTLFIKYVFADEFGCSYFKDKTIILHENPIVELEHIVGCVGEPATFVANAVAPFSDTDIEFWDWSLVNSQTGQTDESTSFTNGDQAIITTLFDSSTYIVSVRGRSANYEPIGNLATCVSIDESTINASTPAVDEERDEIGNTQLIPIGDFPEVDFSWRFIIENEATSVEGKDAKLEPLTDVNGDALNGVSQVWMDWGDGSPLDTLLANEGNGEAFGFEDHIYASDGWYDAKLKINTINGCVDSVTKVIKILPHIVVDPSAGLENNFEAPTQSEAGWFVDETEMGSNLNKTPTTWKYGPLLVDGFTGQGWSTNSNDQAGVQGGYKSDPGSWVFSPSYDISGLEKPMVKFDGFYDFAQNDGAILEYSTNNGDSWSKLGKYLDGDDQGTGLFWYGTLDIRADPGKQRDQIGVNNSSGWGFTANSEIEKPSSIRHKLDEIPEDERQSVRFRFHFASSSASAADIPGLVFDNFTITERGRISLVEQFSNSNINRDNSAGTSNPSVILNNELNSRLDSALLNNNDIVAVNYYTELYGNDPLFEISQDGPSARTLFYGLSDVTSILDGDLSMGANLSTNASTTPWTGAESNRNTLRDAEFGLELILNSSNNDELSVTANITSQKNFTGEDVRVYLAVVEKVLVGVSLPNLELEPRNVFREFLPSPLGHVLTDLSDGGTNTLTETWKIDARKVLDPDQLAVVAFVQKANGDREVYQAARVDVNGKTSILGVGDLIEMEDLNLYPNPANDEFFITFDLTLEEDFQWRLFDQSGRLMKNGEVFKGMDGFRVDSANLPSGLYLMSIGNETKQYTHLKVIVKH